MNPTYRRILVPLDGSPLAERALPFASTLARQHGSDLVLIRAVMAQGAHGGDLPAAQQQLVADARDYVRRVASRLAVGHPPELAVYYAPPVEAILDEVRLRCADLVVMSTHGRSGLSRMALGSVADQVVRQARVPVLLVPEACRHTWEGEGAGQADRPLRILVPLDGSPHAEAALGPARAVAAGMAARVTLFSVVDLVPALFYAAPPAAQRRDAEPEVGERAAYLQGLVGRLSDVSETRVCVEVDRPVSLIAQYVREHKVDLVVMATHGRGGLSRLVLGSVASELLGMVDVPLLVVRPDEPSASLAA